LRSVNVRFVASETFASLVPEGVILISGSAPTFPISITLFSDRLILIPLSRPLWRRVRRRHQGEYPRGGRVVSARLRVLAVAPHRRGSGYAARASEAR